jgi:DNA repair protein RadC
MQYKIVPVLSSKVREEQTLIDSSELVCEYHQTQIRPTMADSQEHLHVLLTTSRIKTKAWFLVSLGTVSETCAHPREILRPVIVGGAHGFILVHNHPSGDPAPSTADRELTKRVHEASAIMNIRFLDHVIIGDDTNTFFSFRQAGLL